MRINKLIYVWLLLLLFAGCNEKPLKINYNITFESNGGLPAPRDQVIARSDKIRQPATMTKAGHTFLGWYSDSTLTSKYIFSSPVKTAVRLYAGWSSVGYHVDFEANGGLPVPVAQTVLHGKMVRLPGAITKPGYTFAGWYSDARFTRLYDFSSPVTAPLKLYARWGAITPVTSKVIEGNYFVFDINIPWKLTQDLVLQGSFIKGNIANYANDNDYSPTFEYSDYLGSSWHREKDMKYIRIKRGKTSVRVRVRTNADEQKEVLREHIEIVFWPVGIFPVKAAGFTHKTNMVIEDDDVPPALRQNLAIHNHELMRFDVKNNVFILRSVIDSVNNQREKQMVDSLYKDIVDAVRAINVGSPADLKFFSLNFQQPSSGGSLVGGFVRTLFARQPVANSGIYLVDGFLLSLNSAFSFWAFLSEWAPQPFNEDGFFGRITTHEYGHLLTLNKNQCSYAATTQQCKNFGGMFAGGTDRCFQQDSYGKRLLLDFYDSTEVKPVSKAGLKAPTMVSNYAGTNCLEDLAENFASYVGLSEDLVVSDTAYAAYRNKIALYKSFPQAVNFKQVILNTKLNIQKTGLSAGIFAANSFVIGLDDGTHIDFKYGGDEGCVRGPIFIE